MTPSSTPPKQINMWYVYILLCSDNSLYTGTSDDMEKRFQNHLSGKGAKYTRSHKPVKIIYKESFPTRGAALSREIKIKSWSRNKKISHLQLKLIKSARTSC